MSYGSIYAKLSNEILKEIGGFSNSFFCSFIRPYFRIFGYPDIAGHGRFPIVINLLKSQKGEKILDLGCGNGIYANTLAFEYGALLTGYDIDKERIEVANKIADFLHNNAKFFDSEIEKINLNDGSIDKIICIEVIEHIEDDKNLLKNFSRWIKKDGVLVLSTPKKENLTCEEESKLFGETKKGEHVRSGYEMNDLILLLEQNGFKVEKWEPYYRYFSRIVIKLQQKFYQRKWVFLNLITFPLFCLFSNLDVILRCNPKRDSGFGWYRGFVIKARKI